LKGSVVVPEKREAELKRLLKEQHKARQDEVFGVSLQRNVLNTKEKQIGFTHWKAKFRQARSLKIVRCLQRQSRKGSTDCSSDSRRQRAKPKKTAEEKGDE